MHDGKGSTVASVSEHDADLNGRLTYLLDKGRLRHTQVKSRSAASRSINESVATIEQVGPSSREEGRRRTGPSSNQGEVCLSPEDEKPVRCAAGRDCNIPMLAALSDAAIAP